MPPPSSAPFSTPSTAFTTMESSRDFKYVCFPLSHPSSLHLLERHENIQWPQQWHSHRQLSISTHPVCSSSHKEKNSAFSQWATHLSCQLFWLCFPRSRKKIPATGNPRTSGAQVWSLPHAYTNEIQADCFLSVQPSLPTFASATISLFVPTTPLPSPSMPTPKLNFRVGFRPSQVLYLTSRRPQPTQHPQRFTLPLAHHHHHHDRCAIPRRSSPPDKNGVLELA